MADGSSRIPVFAERLTELLGKFSRLGDPDFGGRQGRGAASAPAPGGVTADRAPPGVVPCQETARTGAGLFHRRSPMKQALLR